MLFERWFMSRYAFAVVVVMLGAFERVLAVAAERNRVVSKATRRPGTTAACANRSNMFVDRWFMFRYAFAIVVVVLGAFERVLDARLAAYGRLPAHYHAPSRLSTVPACSNRLYMFPDLRFVTGNVFAAVVVVVRCDFSRGRRELAAPEDSGLRRRPPASQHAPGRLTTSPVCSIHSSMPSNLCFVFAYAFAVVVVVWLANFRGGRRVSCARLFCLRLVHMRLCPPKLDLTDSNNAGQFHGLHIARRVFWTLY
jgi:hypothetical protein